MFELTPADPPESNMEPHISITVITNVPWEKYHLHIIYTIHKQTNHEFFLFPWWAEVKGDRSPAAIERWANITERRGRSHVFFLHKTTAEMVNMWKWRLLDLCSSFFWMLRHCDVCWSWLLNPNCSLEFKFLRAYRKIMKAGDEVTNNKTWVLYRCCAASTCINHQLFFWRTLDSRMCNVGDSECFR